MHKDETVCANCIGCKNDSLCLAMDKLTDRQRFVIVKIYADQYTEDEVAEMLGVKQQTVHFHKTKALAELRSSLSKSGIKSHQT
jgi:RNA polymerase sigma factor (sigma-70 family)